MVFRNPSWDPNTLNFDGLYALTGESEFKVLDADNPEILNNLGALLRAKLDKSGNNPQQ